MYAVRNSFEPETLVWSSKILHQFSRAAGEILERIRSSSVQRERLNRWLKPSVSYTNTSKHIRIWGFQTCSTQPLLVVCITHWDVRTIQRQLMTSYNTLVQICWIILTCLLSRGGLHHRLCLRLLAKVPYMLGWENNYLKAVLASGIASARIKRSAILTVYLMFWTFLQFQTLT